MFDRIVVPVDGSSHSKKALNLACDIADKYDSKLYIIHVVQSVPESLKLVLGSSRVSIKTPHEDLVKAGKKVIDAAKKIATEHGCEVADTKSTAGSPTKQILKYAQRHHPDAIIMGSRGLTDIEGLFLGSVSHKVGHHAQCTCITVR
jgi:nucleotide-binding universal stress UspA family protein